MGSRKRFPPLCSDGPGELGERDRDAPVRAGFDTKFVVASPKVLHERATAHYHPCGVLAFESPHRVEPRFESTMVGLDPTVRIPGGVMEHARHELIDDSEERPRSIGNDLGRRAMTRQRRREEPSRGSGIASWGHLDVDDLAVLVDGPIEVAPPAGDLHVSLVDIPAIADRVPARAGRVDQQWGEPLHPPVHGHMIDLDPALRQQLLHIAIRKAEPEVTGPRLLIHLL
jgi:hypothetical protein